MSGIIIIITDQEIYISIKISQKKERGAIPFYGQKFIHLNYFARRKRRKQGIR